MGIILWPHLTKVRCVTHPPTKGIFFLFMLNLANASCLICNSHQSLFNFLNAYSMSITANSTFMASFPKRPDITGAPNQVFKFDNFLDCLIGGITSIPYLLLGPSTWDLYAPNTFMPPRSISIWLVNPLPSLETCPIKWASSI